MKTELNDLRESNEFLNILLDNFNSAVLIANKNLRIYHLNNSFCQLFGENDASGLHTSFGKAAGCVNAVMEGKACGETSKCDQCKIRRCIVETFIQKVPANKIWLEKSFFIDGKIQKKYMEFSTRPISFRGQDLILVIIYDVTEIEEKKQELEKKQKQIDADLAAAAEIQKSLLPDTVPAAGPVSMVWKFEPSEKIGGDIFNICAQDDRRLCLYMLDVCGHGVPAALITVAVSQFLHSRRSHPELFREMDAPAKILSQLNQAFPFSRFETYFSIINMAIDGTEGQLIYGNAGHPPPILLMRNGGTRLLEHHGPVIGVSDQHIYEQRVVDLTPGDRVILYTDGLLDVTNNDNEFFGKFRFIDLLEKLRDVPLQEMADTVQWKIKQFSAGNAPEDDITFLAIQYDG